jgi:hypothetical protein
LASAAGETHVKKTLLHDPSDKILSALAMAADTVRLHRMLAPKNNNLPANRRSRNITFLEEF